MGADGRLLACRTTLAPYRGLLAAHRRALRRRRKQGCSAHRRVSQPQGVAEVPGARVGVREGTPEAGTRLGCHRARRRTVESKERFLGNVPLFARAAYKMFGERVYAG